MQKNNLPTTFCQLEYICEYFIFEQAYKKWKQEQEFKNFCLEIMDNELHKQLEFI